VPREEIPRHYAAAHVFSLPSFNEGMSLAALEAMGAGLPLVLTHTGGTDELVEEGVNGFTHDWGMWRPWQATWAGWRRIVHWRGG